MPKLTVSVPHTRGQAAATERLKGLLVKAKERSLDKVTDLTEEWGENNLKFAFSTFGQKIKGEVAVEEDKVNVDVDLPFMAMMFKGKIEQELKDSLNKALA